MSFSWLGTFRQGSWQVFRRFILEERRDVAQRIRIIEAELTRIGEVEIIFDSEEDNEGRQVLTEKRLGLSVSPNSSMAKLIQAYVAMGGNPFDISLFLSPETTVDMTPNDPDSEGQETQPYNGVVSPKSGSYTPGVKYEGGYMTLKKYLPAKIGGRRHLDDTRVADRVDIGRRWVNKEIRYKRNDIESRILKLCDLREQLTEELEGITVATAAVASTIPLLDPERYPEDLTVAQVVAAIDSVFYVMDEDNVPDFDEENTEALGRYPYLLSDDPEEDNTAL